MLLHGLTGAKPPISAQGATMRTVNVILFNDFETLDAFGPIELFGRLKDEFSLRFFSREGGPVISTQGAPVVTEPFASLDQRDGILLIPGGDGVRDLVKDSGYIARLAEFAATAEFILTVCTGSILFSKTGLLDGKNATSNKRLFQWTSLESPAVRWIKKARWVRDGKVYTSSGISAGMDMALGFIADLLGYEVAKRQSVEIEYDWRENSADDPFADVYP